MVSRIPNDIFQFSLPSAERLTTPSSPTPSRLSSYGNNGIGTLADGRPVLCLDGVAWCFSSSNDSASHAPADAALSFVQVTTFEPEFRVEAKPTMNRVIMDSYWLLNVAAAKLSHGQSAGGPNSFMPFRVRGRFDSVCVAHGMKVAAAVEILEDSYLRNVRGTMFGFFTPEWAAGVSVAGCNCYFLTDEEKSERVGGRVLYFESKEEPLLEYAVTGRHHLGMPRGAEWEAGRL